MEVTMRTKVSDQKPCLSEVPQQVVYIAQVTTSPALGCPVLDLHHQHLEEERCQSVQGRGVKQG